MSSGPRIVIRPEEVAAPLRVAAPLSTYADSSPGSKIAWLWVILATFVPLVNAWVWWQLPVRDVTGRRLAKALAVVSCGLSLLFVSSIALLTFYPQVDWIERTASDAEASVVMIAAGDALGTGVVIASHGERHLILTNKHVVQDAAELMVASRTTSAASGKTVALALSDNVDLALVVVESAGLRPLGPIARFDAVRVGQRVVAVGHPQGLDYTITEGIVSAKRWGTQLQTTAAIRPGNSGGPLVNQRGEIVGINTWIVREEVGLGFAHRADLALDRAQWNFTENVDDLFNRVLR